MPEHTEIVHSSWRSDGRDTIPVKATNFLKVDSLKSGESPEPEPKYELWTEEHSAQSRARRENRENRVKPPPVAEVPDFDLDSHLREVEKEKAKEKSKWKLW